jgi:hypothetical protein
MGNRVHLLTDWQITCVPAEQQLSLSGESESAYQVMALCMVTSLLTAEEEHVLPGHIGLTVWPAVLC